MIWLVPIGFLGLIGVIALIVIYVIKPNYQQKLVSSTYVWKLSLKYKKRRLPINRLQNILQFICQLLVLTISGLLLAQPVLAAAEASDPNEKIVIIDASASMLMSDGNETRFDRAIEEAKLIVGDTFNDGSVVSVIVADAIVTPDDYLAKQVTADAEAELLAKLDELECTYGTADIDGAIELATEILNRNNGAKVFLCTATKYLNKHDINVVDVSGEDEWNAAILDCTARLDDTNHYEIKVDVGCYGRTEAVSVNLVVHGVNGKNQTASLVKAEYFDPTEEEKTIVFNIDDFGSEPLYAYDYLEVYISSADSFAEDNLFFLYGGKRPTIRIQYASSKPNRYFGGIIRTIRQNMREVWDVDFKQLAADDEAATEGFDLYIFEHRMPEQMPTDGVVLLVNPDEAPSGSELVIGDTVDVDVDSTLAAGIGHDLMQYVDSNRITIARYKEVLSAPGYDELAYYNGKPIILSREDASEKVLVWAFDLHYSNLIALPDFSFMMYNLFNHYIPRTLTQSSFEIGETVELSARGTNLTVMGEGVNEVFEASKGTLDVRTPGSYTVTQRPMQGDELIIENFYVHVPNSESNITEEIDELPILSYEKQTGIDYKDLLFYFAIALVSLIFVERIIEIRKKL